MAYANITEHLAAVKMRYQIIKGLASLRADGPTTGEMTAWYTLDVGMLLAENERLRASLGTLWTRIHTFNKEWYNGGFCVLCAEDMLAHSPECPLQAARSTLEE